MENFREKIWYSLAPKIALLLKKREKPYLADTSNQIILVDAERIMISHVNIDENISVKVDELFSRFADQDMFCYVSRSADIISCVIFDSTGGTDQSEEESKISSASDVLLYRYFNQTASLEMDFLHRNPIPFDFKDVEDYGSPGGRNLVWNKILLPTSLAFLNYDRFTLEDKSVLPESDNNTLTKGPLKGKIHINRKSDRLRRKSSLLPRKERDFSYLFHSIFDKIIDSLYVGFFFAMIYGFMNYHFEVKFIEWLRNHNLGEMQISIFIVAASFIIKMSFSHNSIFHESLKNTLSNATTSHRIIENIVNFILRR